MEVNVCIIFNQDKLCSIHDLTSKSQVSHIMAKAVDDVEIISSTYLNGKWMMDNRTWCTNLYFYL
jgi:hypothetical protein